MRGLDESSKLLSDYEVCNNCKKVMVKRVYAHTGYIPLCSICLRGKYENNRIERRDNRKDNNNIKDSSYAQWNR
jgi:hypothetical protein